MLVITRREAEEIVIGDPKDPIGVVRIASIKGDRVRVALEFPRDVPVHRREVAQDIVDRGDRQEPGDTDIAGRIG
ncbi:MAG: carbon storage regulator [Planctomycetota bacterium]|jgi:carbon storage regulator|nr:carbon storage regulator [Phycisphaerales bacterium]MEC8065230.1 carbon storage regulator [Planctomycetota bacterium]MEC8114707.1 carbon storage regulator [Planctomycetota bacterium]MEC8250731.1 carbon storage regulator [Planctomycetota bacterium]MEC8385575.1 carbon storage regulator [Planctomycetota bacterium]